MAYDGSVTFDTEFDASGFAAGLADINRSMDKVAAGAGKAAAGVEQLPAAMDKTGASTSRLTDIVKGSGVFKLIEKGVNAVVASLDSAIDRYDTMNRFPMMLQQMGYGADDANAAVQRLSDGVQGLPTTLDSVVSTAQRLTVLTGNLDQSVDTTLALNNAFLASGAGADGAARGLEQYIQMLSRGEVDMESWRTLQETMGLALNRTAEAFGFAGESAQSDLYAALQSGEITFSQFNAKLLELNNGVGGFADMAKTSSTGIKTAWTNLSTAVVRGAASIIESVDDGLSETKFKSIQNVIESVGKGIETAMKATAPAIKLVASNLDVLLPLAAALTAAYTANTAAAALNKAMHGGLGKALGTASILYGVLTTQGGALVVVQGLLTAATSALSVAFNTLLGPVGLVVLAITALVAGAVALIKWITADSEAYQEQTAALDELAEAQQQVAEQEENNAKTAEENIKSIRASADAAQSLTSELDELAREENKTASQKQRMAALVEELNEKYADLCLTYDEENDRLNMNTQQLQEYIDAQKTMEEAAALQERYNQLLEEESLLRQNQADLDAQEQELADQLEQKLITTGEYNELLEQLNTTRAEGLAQEEEIAARRAELDTQMAALDTATAQTIIDNTAAQQEAAQAAADAEEEEMQRRTDALAAYTEAATDMFDRIDTESELSVDDMIANLEHNQAAVAQWADNLVLLGERGLDQGLLQQLRDAGPEAAGTVAALASATDEQLAHLSEAFANAGEVSGQAIVSAFSLPEVTEAGTNLVDNIAAGVDANQNLDEATAALIKDAKNTAQKSVNANQFRSIGEQIIANITAGVTGTAYRLAEAARAAVQNALSAASSAAAGAAASMPQGRMAPQNRAMPQSRAMSAALSAAAEMAVLRKQASPIALTTASSDTISPTDTAASPPLANARLSPAQLVTSMRNSVASLRSSIAGQLKAASAAAWARPVAAAAAGNTYNSTQNIYFEEPMQAPDEIARALRIEQTYGLAGDRNG